MNSVKLAFAVALLSVLTLTGADCAFVATSGTDRDSSDSEDQRGGGLKVVIGSGRFVDSPVQGLNYTSGSVAGITGANGEFRYEQGQPVHFSVGDIELGTGVIGKAIISPIDLVESGSLDSPAVINIARLLQSLDSIQGDDRITIPVELRRALAPASSPTDASSADFLDFSDSDSFNNAASQLVATLTAGYPFTAVLVDAQTAIAHLRESLSRLAQETPAGSGSP